MNVSVDDESLSSMNSSRHSYTSKEYNVEMFTPFCRFGLHYGDNQHTGDGQHTFGLPLDPNH